jgi:hypothetical protein
VGSQPGLGIAPAPPPARSRARAPRWSTVLLLGGLAVQLAPLVLLPLVLTQDGPAHVAGAWVLLHHGDDGPLGELLREHYAVDLSPVPNMLTTLLLAGLLTVVGPDVAEKLVVGGFVVLLVAGLGYALRGVDRQAGWLAVAALPLAGSQLVVYGFYNFCWGMALALIALGLGLRRRGGWDVRGAVLLSVVLLLTWSAHLLPWAVATLVLGGLAVARSVVGLREGLDPARVAARHLVGPALAVLPTVGLSARYALGGDTAPGAAAGGPGWDRLGELATLASPLVVASRLEVLPAVLVAATLGALAVAALRPRGAGDAALRSDRVVLGTATLLSAAAFLLSPSRLGDNYGFLPDRLAWFPLLLLTLFCATRLPDRRGVVRVAAGSLVLAASAAVLVRLPTELRDQRNAAEVLSAAADLPPGSTFAVLRFSGYEAALAPLEGEPNPLRHLSSRLAVEVGGVDLGHYEAVFPYFQVRFLAGSVRAAVDPGLDGLDEVPPSVDLLAAGGRPQAVVVVGLDEAEPWVRDARRTAHVLADLRAGYEQVAGSGPAGHVSVWRLREEPDG